MRAREKFEMLVVDAFDEVLSALGESAPGVNLEPLRHLINQMDNAAMNQPAAKPEEGGHE